MSIRILLAAFIVTMIINSTIYHFRIITIINNWHLTIIADVNSQGYSMSNGQSRQLGSRGYRPTSYQAAGADFGQQYNPSGQQYGQNERIDPTNQKAEYVKPVITTITAIINNRSPNSIDIRLKAS